MSKTQVIHEIGDYYHNDHRVLTENEQEDFEKERNAEKERRKRGE